MTNNTLIRSTLLAILVAAFHTTPALAATKISVPAANVSASADDGNIPGNTVDGNLATRWSAQGSGVWIQYKLGSCQVIDYARLAWHQGDTRKASFSVSVSKDNGATWAQVLGTTQSSGTTTNFETVQLPDPAANVVRIYGYGNPINAWTSLLEVELYTLGASTACGTSTGTANYPADVFAGLKPWKLTLPTGAGSGSGTAQTLGVGGVATPSGATLTTSDTTSQLNISSGGTTTSPRVYDGQGHTVGRINITADNVVVQNFRINAGSQYGAYISANNVTFQNNDIKGVKVSGDGDLNAITAFGNNISILFNTAINFVSGDPGSSHTDFIQTWVSSSHPTASANWKIIGNKAVGPANPSRVNSIASIHQCIMAEGLGRGGNSGGSGDPHDWVISDNEFGDSWNQCIKLDGVDNVTITRNKFTGSSTKILDISSASSNVKVYSDNSFGSGYGSIGYTVTSGAGPGGTTTGGAQYPATEVKQPALATFSNTYFKLNTNKDGVLFTSLFGGATTSSGTAYARSELREMQADGVTNAAWSCSSGVRKMHIRQRIVKTPIHKPEMVVGQIHDDSNDVLAIHFTGPEDSSGVGTGNGVGTGVMRVHWNNDSSEDVLDTAYAVGDIMTVDVDTSANTMRVNYRNERTGATTVKAKTFSGIVGSCYFKAGNYHQGCSKTNIYGGTNQSCVDKGWVANKYETDPLGTSVLEMFELTMPY
ncbi:hypothetical protein BH11PSE11_BH11PSE11_21240 [soil metagenome]